MPGTCSYERSVWKLWRALLSRTSTSSVRGLISGSLLDHWIMKLAVRYLEFYLWIKEMRSRDCVCEIGDRRWFEQRQQQQRHDRSEISKAALCMYESSSSSLLYRSE